ncbi:hypothetical protein ACRAWF_06920 [Streptomyces sp. L7]
MGHAGTLGARITAEEHHLGLAPFGGNRPARGGGGPGRATSTASSSSADPPTTARRCGKWERPVLAE